MQELAVADNAKGLSIAQQVASAYADQADADFVRSAMELYHPGNRPHPVEWLPEPIEGTLHFGGSSLVKETAREYAEKILTMSDSPDEHEGFYGEQGNKLAEVHFNAITPYQENQVRVHLCDDSPCQPCRGLGIVDVNGGAVQCDHCKGAGKLPRDLIAHMDAVEVWCRAGAGRRNLSFVDPAEWPSEIHLRVLEHKHMDPGDAEVAAGKVDLAERQAALEAVLLDRHLRRLASEGKPMRLIVPPDFNEGRTMPAKPLAIPPHVKKVVIDRLSVHFWPRTDPRALVKSHAVTQEVLDLTLGEYTKKAMAIEAAIRAGAVDKAIDFDVSAFGLQEFTRTPKAREAGLDNEDLGTLCLEYEYASRMTKKFEAVKKDRSGTACAMLAQAGAKTVEVEDGPGKILAKPTAANSSGGNSRYLKPNLRGEFTDKQLELAILTRRAAKPQVVA